MRFKAAPLLALTAACALLLTRGALLRCPLGPEFALTFAQGAALYAWMPPLLYDALLAGCLMALHALEPGREGACDLSCAVPAALYLALLPLSDLPFFGGPVPVPGRLSLSPLFGVLGAAYLLRAIAALFARRGALRFSLRAAGAHAAFLLTALTLPLLGGALPQDLMYARVLAPALPWLSALALLPLCSACLGRRAGIVLTAAGGALYGMSALFAYTPIASGTALRSLVALCVSPLPASLYSGAFFLVMGLRGWLSRRA